MKTSLIKTGKALSVFIFLLVLVACKKDKQEEAVKINPSLVGKWTHIRQLGPGRNQVTEITLNANGTGNELIFTTTLSSSTDNSDEAIKWATEKEVLKLSFKDGQIDEYTYTITEDASTLKLISKSGSEKEFFKSS